MFILSPLILWHLSLEVLTTCSLALGLIPVTITEDNTAPEEV